MYNRWRRLSFHVKLGDLKEFFLVTCLTLVSKTWTFGFWSPRGKIQLVQIHSEVKNKDVKIKTHLIRYRNNNITKVVWTVFSLSHLKNRPQHMSLLLIIRTEEVHSLVTKRFRRKQHPHLDHGLDVLWEDRPVQFVSTKRPANEESSRHPQHLPNDFHPHEVCRETQTVGLCARRDGWWLFLN